MSFRREWRRFRTRPATWGPTPGVREAWHEGRRWYHVWVVRIDDPAVVARRDRVAAALAPWVTPFSRATPHVTVWVSGWEPGPCHAEAGRVVELEVGRVNAFATCPFLEIRAPVLPRLRAGMHGPEERWSTWRPHLTVARFSSTSPAGPIVAALRPLRRLPPLRTSGRFVTARVDAWSEEGNLEFDPD